MKNLHKLLLLLLVITHNLHAGEVNIEFLSDDTLSASQMNTIVDAINDNNSNINSNSSDINDINTRVQSITPTSNALFPRFFVGSTTNTSRTWQRPSTCDDPDSINQGQYFYQTHTLFNLSNEDKPFTVTADWSHPSSDSFADGYLYVYNENGFDATAPLNNCIGINDDFNGIRYSKISGLSVPANSSVTIVTTHIGPGSENTIPGYTLDIYEGVTDIP